jgi:hypothetical protein
MSAGDAASTSATGHRVRMTGRLLEVVEGLLA